MIEEKGNKFKHIRTILILFMILKIWDLFCVIPQSFRVFIRQYVLLTSSTHDAVNRFSKKQWFHVM